MSEITTFREFEPRLRIALEKMQALQHLEGDEPFYGSIVRQLQAVQQWTEGGRRPTQDDLDNLTFGAMASRTVDEVDRPLANELYELSDFLTWWPPSIEVWK